MNYNQSCLHDCWLRYDLNNGVNDYSEWSEYFGKICMVECGTVVTSAVNELRRAIKRMTGIEAVVSEKRGSDKCVLLDVTDNIEVKDGYRISVEENKLCVYGSSENGVLYGVFKLIFAAVSGKKPAEAVCSENPAYALRMIDHWDNVAGDIERGYAGRSIFFKDNRLTNDFDAIKDYARLIASVGINAVCLNNVNVHKVETLFITDEFLDDFAAYADIFRSYGIKLYLSVNYAAPVDTGALNTADPLDEGVKKWWAEAARNVYAHIPDFGGFVVKADSENRPGPFTYGRNHADGANMLAEALEPFGGIVIWRCFVYNCHVDWRDRSTDRAKAAYDSFKQLDGKFLKNVVLQIKNGPMDFQIREATSPLLAAMPNTNQFVEFQITQEYTGHQIDVCYLVPMWKECLDFDTYLDGSGSFIKKSICGAAAVSNIGNDECPTGNPLAAANLYGYGRLIFAPELTAEQISSEWIKLSLGCDEKTIETVNKILLNSREVYENYSSPLGVGWMVVPQGHYGVSVDGYEYSAWGTYHYADRNGVGVDRTAATGTGFTAQYSPRNMSMYENIGTCPDELALFFHYLPYTHILHNGKTVIQHIYDTHFLGVKQVEEMLEAWQSLKDKLPEEIYTQVFERMRMQRANSIEWRDVVNTYFYRKSGIDDEKNRKIYK